MSLSFTSFVLLQHLKILRFKTSYLKTEKLHNWYSDLCDSIQSICFIYIQTDFTISFFVICVSPIGMSTFIPYFYSSPCLLCFYTFKFIVWSFYTNQYSSHYLQMVNWLMAVFGTVLILSRGKEKSSITQYTAFQTSPEP